MPAAVATQVHNAQLWQKLYKINMNAWNTTDDVFMNVTGLLNWTICSIQHLHVLHQKERFQRILTNNNANDWRHHWNISDAWWLRLYAEGTKCNDTMCWGKWIQYNVTNYDVICRFHMLPVISHNAYWVLRTKGEWLDAAKNVTYDLTGCDEMDKGVVCPLRSAYTNPCLKEENALCDWDYQKPDDLLFQLGPHTLCVVTMNQHPQLPCTPFSGCLRNVYVWTWHNITYRLTNYSTLSDFTEVQWTQLQQPKLGISLERFQSALESSKDLKDMINQHDHAVSKLQVTTLFQSKKVEAVAKLVEQNSASHWYDIFTGLSPFARRLLAPPLVILICIIAALTCCNVLTWIRITRLRRHIARTLYNFAP
ncbi:hypothetical protein NL108_016700 [Boleophthalmus pectinirostris]|nr:hypothetical protein NL108_016700 [Boleophthalmus pectinirostris]